MALLPPIIIADSTGQQWYVGCDDTATPVQVPLSVPVSDEAVVPYVYLNSITDGSSWQITVVAAPSINAGDLQATNVYRNPDYPTQLLITAPNGTVYGIQIATVGPPVLGSSANGVIQTILPTDLSAINCTTKLSVLSKRVLERLEDPDSIFWNTLFEVNAGLVEALNETLMLVGRPTQIVASPYILNPNSIFQQVPKGMLLATDIQGPASQLRKVTLWDMNFSLSSWGPDWLNDTSDAGPRRWFPLGFGLFGVHPAPTAPQTVLLDGIAYPVTTPYPYDGSQLVPFEHHWFEMFEMYAAAYSRTKESGTELQEAMPLLSEFYKLAGRMTEIQDTRDPLVFSSSFGGTIGVNSLRRR